MLKNKMGIEKIVNMYFITEMENGKKSTKTKNICNVFTCSYQR